jgi:hypothetical protein
MKKIVFTLITIGLLNSCSSDDSGTNTELVGNWKLIEVLADPGDGSGTFTSVESNKTITFNSDGTISSNGTLCDITITSNNSTSGTYSITESTFNSPSCINPDYNYTFEKNENIIIIDYPCIEPCKAKYKKE